MAFIPPWEGLIKFVTGLFGGGGNSAPAPAPAPAPRQSGPSPAPRQPSLAPRPIQSWTPAPYNAPRQSWSPAPRSSGPAIRPTAGPRPTSFSAAPSTGRPSHVAPIQSFTPPPLVKKEGVRAQTFEQNVFGVGGAGQGASGTPSLDLSSQYPRMKNTFTGKVEESSDRTRLQDAQRAAVSARSSDPGDFQELTQDEYNKLSPQQRAAVDFNGLLHQAKSQDQGLLSKMDNNKDGRVTLKEAQGDTAGFKTAYKRSFDRDAGDDDEYMPATMSLLNAMNHRDSGNARDYAGKRGYVTTDDLTKGYAEGVEEGPMMSADSMQKQARGQMVFNISNGMQNLEKAIGAGRAARRGGDLTVSLSNISNEQRTALVQSMAASLQNPEAPSALALTGTGNRYNPVDGISLNALVDPEEADQNERMGYVAAQMRSQGGTLAQMKDPAVLRRAGFGKDGTTTVGMTPESFVNYINKREKDAAARGETLEDALTRELNDQVWKD